MHLVVELHGEDVVLVQGGEVLADPFIGFTGADKSEVFEPLANVGWSAVDAG
jgi:hypothetical protein